MKIYLVGVGAVGGFYGGLLALSGAEITFVSRGESFRAIREKGLVLHGVDGIHLLHPKVIESMAEISNPDLIILAVKSYSLEEVSRELVDVVGPQTTVVTLQNGLDNDREVAKYLDCQVLPGLVLVAVAKTSANGITPRGPQKKLVFGSRDRTVTPKMREIESIFLKAGIEAVASKNIEYELWKKFLFVVSFSSATVVGNCPIGEALSKIESFESYKTVLKEVIEVGKKEGISFETNIFEEILQGAQRFDPFTKSSLLMDLESHHQTEVEALQGTVIRLAKKHGLPVPMTRAVYERILTWVPA